MEIFMQKIGMFRQDLNPKNSNMNLNIDWSIEFTNTDQEKINFDIVLKSCSEFQFNFKIEGIVKLDLFETFIDDYVSQVIFNKASDVLMNMISITRDSSHFSSISDFPYLDSENNFQYSL